MAEREPLKLKVLGSTPSVADMKPPCKVGEIWCIEEWSARDAWEKLYALILKVTAKKVKIHWIGYEQGERGLYGWHVYVGRNDELYPEGLREDWAWFKMAKKVA